MKILGVNTNLLHDSGAALIENGTLIAAVAEERLTRIKQQSGAPFLSVNAVLKVTNINPSDIDVIALVGWNTPQKIKAFVVVLFRFVIFLQLDFFKIAISSQTFQSVISRRAAPAAISQNIILKAFIDMVEQKRLLNKLKQEGFAGRIITVPHHLCHIAASYASYGSKKKCLIVNIEGSSFAYTTNIYKGVNGVLNEISSTPDPHSAGHFYAGVTEMLGFKPGLHEGKVTGLSSYGRVKNSSKKNQKLHEFVQSFLTVEGLRLYVSKKVFLFPFLYGKDKKLPNEFQNYKKEDIAWAAQKRLEDVVSQLVKNAIAATGIRNIVLTGGVAANVRMNQKVFELKEVDSLFVYPAMGDFGNAHGAAVVAASEFADHVLQLRKLSHLYLGMHFQKKEIEEELKKRNIVYEWVEKDLDKKIAKSLSQGKIVCLFQGRMEYGPRALGNRSILANPASKNIATRLNTALKRSDFMPFAPVVRWENRNTCFINCEKASFAAEFMTITFQATDIMKKKCPAVVHVDGTARPQLLKRNVNPVYYDILHEFEKITTLPALINTSFNMHNEPIVASINDSLDAFFASGLDILILERFVIKKQRLKK